MRQTLVALFTSGALWLTACGSNPAPAIPDRTVAGSEPATTQEEVYAPARLSAADYAAAERFLGSASDDRITGTFEAPTWLPDGRLRYRTRSAVGERVVTVEPTTGSVEQRAAESDGEPWRDEGRDLPRSFVVSPDGRRAAFTREHDLWVRDLTTGEDHRLTADGSEDYGYATNNAGWTRSDRPVLRWSPDSRRIATFRHDARGVGRMYTVSTEVGHPQLDAWRYPLPEDSVIFRIERLVIDVADPAAPTLVWLDMPADPHRSTVCDHVYCGGTFTDVEWSSDGSELAFVSSSRDHKRATLRWANPVTGEVRDVLEERVPTFFESGYRTYNWRFLPESNEVIWYSRKSDWGHLYLHDLETGTEKRAITSGNWNVLEVLHVDPETRTIWFTGNEREPGDPYFHYLYRVGIDDGDVTLLTPDSAHHEVTLSPDGRFVTDSYSTPTSPPVTVLRDARTGDVLHELERTDITGLLATGWQPPVPFTVRARDGETDLHGLLFRPTDLDPSLRYPVVNYIYPGPQSGSVGSRSFAATRRDHQALAELGFIVVTVDAMGTPQRSRSFHEAYYGDMGDNGLPDQVGAIRQLAERFDWIDLDRVGVWGHSGGGFASAGAILRYPEFYSVAVSQAGNHDNRNYEDDWGEKWHGLLETRADGTTSYDSQANQLLAGNLEGKLLLAHGLMDDNVPASNTLLLIQALIDAGKDFDLVLFPDARHGFAMHPYMIRRRWDYFVRHLLGAEPPAQYTIGEGR
ncbi:MAG: DPP IV N-terminal domain-containing protein [Gemmatimonadota bacterium]